MGLFSGIGKVFSKVASPVAGAIGAVGNVFQSASNNKTTQALINSMPMLMRGIQDYALPYSAYSQSVSGGREARALQLAAAQRQMDFQERMVNTAWQRSQHAARQQYVRAMHAGTVQHERARNLSSTAYQRGMEDMRKAGLNPILAYKQGGASTPGLSQPSFGMASAATAQGAMPTIQDIQTPAIGVGQRQREQSFQLREIDQRTAFLKEQMYQTIADTALKKTQEQQWKKVIDKTIAETRQIEKQIVLTGKDIDLREQQVLIEKQLQKNITQGLGRSITEIPAGLIRRFNEEIDKILEPLRYEGHGGPRFKPHLRID